MHGLTVGDAKTFIAAYRADDAHALEAGDTLTIDWEEVCRYDPDLADVADSDPETFHELVAKALESIGVESVSVELENTAATNGGAE